MEHIYDVIIIGGGPAGYTAALYTARAGLDTLILEKLSAGGQMALTTDIDNYPGFDEGIDGFLLGEKMQSGAERFGAKSELAEVSAVDTESDIKVVKTDEGDFYARALVIATGAKPRLLGVKMEQELTGRGVHYCATCDGRGYAGKKVAVIGGGNSAVEDALALSKIAEEVVLIHRRDTLRATKVYHEPLMKQPNVKFLWNSAVEELLYDKRLTGIKVKNLLTDKITSLAVDGIFVSVGRMPETQVFQGKVKIDEFGYIVADESTKTNVKGVFAAGDVRTKAVRQVVTAAADGAVAAHYIEEYLLDK